jgi:hypothetical protein|nr:MAG TPA: head tail connector [Caudoviricetes sp.]
MNPQQRIRILSEAADFLKVEEDDSSLGIILDAAAETLENAVGNIDIDDSARTKLALFLLMQNIYDNRTLLESRNGEKMSNIVKTIILQLQLENWSEES